MNIRNLDKKRIYQRGRDHAKAKSHILLDERGIIFLLLERFSDGRLQRIKLNGSRARSCLPFTRTLALVKIVPTWISSSSSGVPRDMSFGSLPHLHFSPHRCVSLPGADLIRDSALDLIRYTAVCMP